MKVLLLILVIVVIATNARRHNHHNHKHPKTNGVHGNPNTIPANPFGGNQHPASDPTGSGTQNGPKEPPFVLHQGSNGVYFNRLSGLERSLVLDGREIMTTTHYMARRRLNGGFSPVVMPMGPNVDMWPYASGVLFPVTMIFGAALVFAFGFVVIWIMSCCCKTKPRRRNLFAKVLKLGVFLLLAAIVTILAFAFVSNDLTGKSLHHVGHLVQSEDYRLNSNLTNLINVAKKYDTSLEPVLLQLKSNLYKIESGSMNVPAGQTSDNKSPSDVWRVILGVESGREATVLSVWAIALFAATLAFLVMISNGKCTHFVLFFLVISFVGFGFLASVHWGVQTVLTDGCVAIQASAAKGIVKDQYLGIPCKSATIEPVITRLKSLYATAKSESHTVTQKVYDLKRAVGMATVLSKCGILVDAYKTIEPVACGVMTPSIAMSSILFLTLFPLILILALVLLVANKVWTANKAAANTVCHRDEDEDDQSVLLIEQTIELENQDLDAVYKVNVVEHAERPNAPNVYASSNVYPSVNNVYPSADPVTFSAFTESAYESAITDDKANNYYPLDTSPPAYESDIDYSYNVSNVLYPEVDSNGVYDL